MYFVWLVGGGGFNISSSLPKRWWKWWRLLEIFCSLSVAEWLSAQLFRVTLTCFASSCCCFHSQANAVKCVHCSKTDLGEIGEFSNLSKVHYGSHLTFSFFVLSLFAGKQCIYPRPVASFHSVESKFILSSYRAHYYKYLICCTYVTSNLWMFNIHLFNTFNPQPLK